MSLEHRTDQLTYILTVQFIISTDTSILNVRPNTVELSFDSESATMRDLFRFNRREYAVTVTMHFLEDENAIKPIVKLIDRS